MHVFSFLFCYDFSNSLKISFWVMSSPQQSFSRECYKIAYFHDKPREGRLFSLGDLFLRKAILSKIENAVGAHKALSWSLHSPACFSANPDFLGPSRWFYAGCCLQLTKLIRDWCVNSECKFNLQWEMKFPGGLMTHTDKTNIGSTNLMCRSNLNKGTNPCNL